MKQSRKYIYVALASKHQFMSTARITKSLQLQEIKNIDVIVDYEIPGVIRLFYFSRYTEK